MAYSDKVLDHYQQPAQRRLTRQEQRQDVGTGVVGAPECGDVMKLQIQVDESTGQASPKPSLRPTAAARRSRRRSLATEWIKGVTRSTKRSRIKNTQIVEELSLPPVKIHCSVLAEDAIKAAIDDWRYKSARRATASDSGHQPEPRPEQGRGVMSGSNTTDAKADSTEPTSEPKPGRGMLDHRARRCRRCSSGSSPKRTGSPPTRHGSESAPRAAGVRASATCWTSIPNRPDRVRSDLRLSTASTSSSTRRVSSSWAGTIARLQRRPARPWASSSRILKRDRYLCGCGTSFSA